jgi:hypothetical protein
MAIYGLRNLGKPEESLLLVLLRNCNIRLTLWVLDIWKEFDWPKLQELLNAAPDLFKSKELRKNLMLSSAHSLAESCAIKCEDSERAKAPGWKT